MLIKTVIVDIGAGLCQQYQDMLTRDLGLIIHCITPLGSLLTLEEHFRNRLHVYSDFVISDADTNESDVYIDDATGDYSLLPFNQPNIRRWKLPPFQTKRPGCTKVIKLPTKTFETFIRDVKLNGGITLLNINIQGYANKVLAGITTKRTWSAIKEITVKVHTIDYELYQNQTKLTDVMDTLLVHCFAIQSQSKRSQTQEIVICFRNQSDVQNKWPFAKYALGYLVTG